MRGLTLSVVFIFSLMSTIVFAEKKVSRQDVIKKEKKLEDVKKQIREEKKNVKSISDKETTVLEELEGINKNLVEKREELKKIEAVLAGIQKNVNSTNSGINRLERERQALLERLKARLRAMYKMRRGESMNVLFSSDSSKDLGRRHKYLTIIMDSDSNLIAGYEKNLSRLESEKTRLSALYKEMESVRQTAVAKKGETEALQRERTALLTDVKQEKDRRLKVIKELEQAAEELTDLLNRLREEEDRGPAKEQPSGDSTGFAAMKGRLHMPVDGTVVSFYGKVKHPRFQTVTFNNGIVIEAPVGAPVKSVYDGKVIYVGWLKGYGQVMIIDHSGGFYTLFAHLSKVLKEKGDEVKRDMEVGLVGDTGPSSTAGLYFEIRQKGVPRDPMAWLAEK